MGHSSLHKVKCWATKVYVMINVFIIKILQDSLLQLQHSCCRTHWYCVLCLFRLSSVLCSLLHADYCINENTAYSKEDFKSSGNSGSPRDFAAFRTKELWNSLSLTCQNFLSRKSCISFSSLPHPSLYFCFNLSSLSWDPKLFASCQAQTF